MNFEYFLNHFYKMCFFLQKAAYKAAAAPSGQSAPDADAEKDYSEGKYGVSKLIQSQDYHQERVFTNVFDLPEFVKNNPGKNVWVRGRVHTSRAKGKQCFLILRQQSSTIQCVIAVNDIVSKQMVKFTGRLVINFIYSLFVIVQLIFMFVFVFFFSV